jgi:uncharacterized protein YdeI (YjbR/CyaY-like superfamily)
MTREKSEPQVPTDLRKVLAGEPKVTVLWKDLTPIARRDFITWIESAKQKETRKRRISSLGSRLLSGKRRPCCFALVPMNLYKALGASPKAKAAWKDLTPNERRDFVSWIDEAKNQALRGIRIEEACLKLAAGKRRP